MKKVFLFGFLLLVAAFLSGCGGGTPQSVSTSSDQPTLSQSPDTSDSEESSPPRTGPYTIPGTYGTITLENGYKIPKDALFIDIRNDWERQNWQQDGDELVNPNLPQGSVGNAVYEYRDQNRQNPRQVRDEFVDEVLNLAKNNKHRHIILICHSSSRTKKAAKLLSENGFTYIEQIDGGLNEWNAYHLPVGTVKEIRPASSHQIPEEALFIDVRNAWERDNGNYARGSLYGAVYEYRDKNGQQPRRVRPEFVNEVLNLAGGDRHKKIILICHTSSRTTKATKLLTENGFTDIAHIKGGLDAWKANSLPLGE
ncbi:MAG: hypothetical protein B6D59_05020 [Campylobacteraceae bacterium 4484_4]|nr:MAG: hypothetical protein B6D59_05020 [Campylobacteraceae bacterium 4484_4]